MVRAQNPAQAEVLPSGLGVQPDGPLSGEVKRGGATWPPLRKNGCPDWAAVVAAVLAKLEKGR